MKKTKMLKSIIAGIGLIFVIMFHTDNSFAVIPPNHVEIEKWIQTTFAKGKLPPFSFVYQGISSADFIKTWDFESKKLDSTDPNLVNYIITYSDKKTGLNVDCHITGYTDFQAVEWVLNITNHSGNHSGVLEQVKALDYSIESKDKKPFILHHAKGSDYGEGIQDFNPYSTPIKVGDKLHFTPTGGRPSDKTAFPFYNIESPDNKGVMLSIGWTGNWVADFSCSSPNSTTVTVGQLKMKLFLYPEESIRTPEVCLLFWQGEDRMIGHNTFRRFILAHHSPKIDGKPITKLLSASFSAMQMPEPCPAPNSCLTEATALAFIDRYKYYGLTPDIFWMDAGWALGTGMPNDYATGAGNPMVDLYRFPNGLKPISEAAHKAGAKFMVWFEPERVFTGSWLDREHPNWVLKLEGNPTEMLDLGNKDALEWLCHQYGDLIEKNGIDYYRQDNNIHLSPYWDAYDEPERIGMKEIRHVEGLYKFWDYLLKRFPNLMIDNCASGGRRLDLETTSRSIPLWRSDFENHTEGSQNHVYGLNFYLPQHGTGLSNVDPYCFRSFLGNAMVLNWNIFSRSFSIPAMQQIITQFRQISPYFLEDYYPLTGIDNLTKNDIWLAYQLHRPTDQTGIIIAFRRKDCQEQFITVALKGVDPKKNYILKNSDTNEVLTKSGKELLHGFTLSTVTAPGSVLISYKPAKK